MSRSGPSARLLSRATHLPVASIVHLCELFLDGIAVVSYANLNIRWVSIHTAPRCQSTVFSLCVSAEGGDQRKSRDVRNGCRAVTSVKGRGKATYLRKMGPTLYRSWCSETARRPSLSLPGSSATAAPDATRLDELTDVRRMPSARDGPRLQSSVLALVARVRVTVQCWGVYLLVKVE